MCRLVNSRTEPRRGDERRTDDHPPIRRQATRLHATDSLAEGYVAVYSGDIYGPWMTRLRRVLEGIRAL